MFYVFQMNDGRWQVDAFTSSPQSARLMAARAPGFDTKDEAEAARRDMVHRWAEARPCGAAIPCDRTGARSWQT